MMPTLMPIIKEMCKEFISSFFKQENKEKSPKLTHDGTWKESEEEITCVVKEIFGVLKDIWNNPAFSFEHAKSLNEGTYQSTIILLALRAVLKNLPINNSSYITTSEKQSVASADRKGEGHMGRRPDIMLIIKYLEMTFELMYVECSRLFCSPQKKTDNEIKL